MKKFCITSFKVTALSMMVISPFTALIAYYSQNQWDPIKEIQQLKNQNRRDDAIDLVGFLKDNQLNDDDEMADSKKMLLTVLWKRQRHSCWMALEKDRSMIPIPVLVPWPLTFVYSEISVTLPSRHGTNFSKKRISME